MTHPYPQPQPKKSNRTVWIVLVIISGAMFVMFASCIAFVASVGGTQQPGSPPAAQPDNLDDKGTQPATEGVGDTITSGDLELTVTKVETAKQVSDESGFATETARGKYVIVYAKITNNGDDPLSFSAGAVPFIDQDGNRHQSTADVAFALGNSDLAEPVNPGSTAEGFIAYDVPEQTKVKQSHIEATGGFLEEPVKVLLK